MSASGLARAAIGIVGFLVAISCLGALGFTYLLANGPIDLENFKPRLLAALQDRLGPSYVVSLGSTYLMKTRDGFGVSFGFNSIEIDDREGRQLLSAPGGRLSLDLLGLLALDVRVRRVQIDHLVLNMRILADGRWEIGAGRPDVGGSVVEAAPTGVKTAELKPDAAIAALISALEGDQRPLDHFAIAGGTLKVANELIGKSTTFEDFSIAYDRHTLSAEFKASARGPAGPWSIAALADFGFARRLTIEAKDVSYDDLMLLASQHSGFFTDMPISLRLDAALDGAGALTALEGKLGLGAGYFRLDDPDFTPILFDETTSTIGWNASKHSFEIHSLESLIGASHFHFTGDLAPPPASGEPWALHLVSHDSVLAPQLQIQPEVAFDDITFDAHAFPDTGRFVLDRLKLHGPKIDGQMSAEVSPAPSGDGPEVKMNLSLNRSSLLAAVRIWPTFINPDAHNWCQQHIHAGDLGGATMRLDWSPADLKAAHEKRPVAADSVRGDFTFIGAAADVLEGLPQLTGLDATGYITGRVFNVEAKHGLMTFASGRKLDAADAYFRVPDTAPAPIVAAEGGAHVTGGADAAAELLSQDAIRKFAGLALDPANVKGQAQGQLTMNLSMGKTAKPEDQKFHVNGSLSGLQLEKYAGNARFEQGALDFDATSEALKATGQGQLNSIPTKVEMDKGATDEGAINLLMTIDDALRTKLGLSFGLPMSGPMTVKMRAPLGQGAAEAEVDLSKVEVLNFDGSVVKAAGKPGKATFTLKSGPDGIAVTGIAVDASPIVARGTAQFAADGAVQNVKLSQLKFAAADDVRLELTGGSVTKASLRGASLDGRALLHSVMSRDAGVSALKDLDVDAKVASVLGMNDTALGAAELTMSRRGGVMRAVNLTGKLGQGTFGTRMDEGGALNVRAADAGAMARFLDLYQRLEGGALDLTLSSVSGGRGQATLKRFALRGEAALKRMEAATPGRQGVRAPDANATPVEGDLTRFDKMTASFVRSTGRIDITDMAVNSASQGINLQGMVDFARDKLDISGVYVPAYGVNSLMNKIPVVGMLLAGGEHEGVFGVNFRISGALSAPTLTVNPFSGVTPGIFRKLFGAFDGTSNALPAGRSPEN